MICPECQFENRDGAKFCKECGSKLEIQCPSCGFQYQPGSKFCDECGHDLRASKESPTIDLDQPQSYTPKFLADKILTSRRSIEGERKLVTVLFADVANYTSISEKLDPEEVHQIMDGCFNILMEEIHRYEGTINQFTGDGVMALFGAPIAHEDHAQRACHAALSIQSAIKEYGEKINKDTGVEFKMRIGLNSGPVIVGSIGDDLRMDYTAVGDTTNLASRMESLAQPGAIVGSKNTYNLARDFFQFQSLGDVEVKGKEVPQEAYELIKTSEVETRIEAAVAKGLTKFVGRTREMEALKEAFKKAQSGSGQVAGIVGEAGVGKSRLLIELRNILPEGEYSYLEGRCLHYGGSMPYLPVLDILRSYLEIKEGDREYILKKKMEEKVLKLGLKLEMVLPPFQELFSLKVDDEAYFKLEPKEKRDRTFEAIRDLLIRVSQDKSLIVAVEDLHWIDKSTEEFLDYLIGWLANTHILLIILYRPEYTHQWGSKSYYSKIGVDQLSNITSEELVQAILGDAEVEPELRDLVLGRAGGNPLFVEELAQSLVENGSIQRKDKQYVLTREISEIDVPDTIQGIIAARIDRVEEVLKRIMQVASVIGREFAFRLLQSIMGMREELKAHLLNLQGLEFIYEKSLFPELEYIFKHALTQEVAYNSLLQKRRKEIHERIGATIEQMYSERLEEFYEMLAYHYLKGENSEKAYQYLKLSGNKAVRNYANLEAFGFYCEAIEVLAKKPETEENKREQIEIRRLMGPPMISLVFPEGSLQILKDGERIAEEIGDNKSLAIFYSYLANFYQLIGDLIHGTEYSEKSFQEAQKIEDIDLLVPTGDALVFSNFYRGEALKCVDKASILIGLLEKTQRESDFFGRLQNPYVMFHGFCGSGLAYLGNFKDGEVVLEKGLRFARRINHLPSLAGVEWNYGLALNLKSDGRNALRHLNDCLECVEAGNVQLLLPIVFALLGRAHYYLGELETARNHLDKSLKIQKAQEQAFFQVPCYHTLTMVHLDLGEFESAKSYAEKAMNLTQESKSAGEGISLIHLGRIQGKKEPTQMDKAEEYILRGIKILDEFKIKPYVSRAYYYLGKLYADKGLNEKAFENLKKAEQMFITMGMDYYLAKTQEALERV